MSNREQLHKISNKCNRIGLQKDPTVINSIQIHWCICKCEDCFFHLKQLGFVSTYDQIKLLEKYQKNIRSSQKKCFTQVYKAIDLNKALNIKT